MGYLPRYMPFVVVVAIGLFWRLIFLGSTQLNRDEAASWYIAMHPLGSIPGIVSHDTYQPFYPMVLHAWISLFGSGEAALRLPAVIAGIGTLAVIWAWTRQAAGAGTAFVAALMVSLSPTLIRIDRLARMHAFETLFATLAWSLLWLLVARGSRHGRVWQALVVASLGIAVAGEVWSMPMGIPNSGLQLLFALIALAWLRNRVSLAAAGAVFLGALSLVPWLPYLLRIAGGGTAFWTPVPNLGAVAYTIRDWVIQDFGGIAFGAVLLLLALLLAGLGLWALATGRLTSRDEGRLLALALLLDMGLVPVVFLYSQIHSIYDPRYLGSAAPPFFIALSLGIAAATRWARSRRTTANPGEPGLLARTIASRSSGIALTGVVVVSMLAGAVCQISDLHREISVDAARETAAELAGRVQPGDVVLALNAQTYFPLDYYLDDATRDRLGIRLLECRRPDAAYFTGWQVIDGSARIDAPRLSSEGWGNALGLGPHNTVWLVALDDQAKEFRRIAPYEQGQVVETLVFTVPGAVRVGVVHALRLSGP